MQIESYIVLFLCVCPPDDLHKTFDLSNKNVLKYTKYPHWYRVKLCSTFYVTATTEKQMQVFQ